MGVLDGVLDDVRARTGVPWRLGDALPGGHQGGARLLVAPHRPPVVLKTSTKSGWGAQVVRAQHAVAAVRRQGYPTPAWLAAGETAAAVAWHVEEFADGAPAEAVDAALLVDVIESQADLDPDPGRCWTDFVLSRLDAPDDLAGIAGEPGRRLAERCARLRAGARGATWPRTDMVHGDFRPANVLLECGVVTAVVDVEAIGSGPRAFDHATLLSHERIDPDGVELVARAGAKSADSRVLRACVAHVFSDLVAFVAHRDPADAARVAGDLEARAATVEELVPPR